MTASPSPFVTQIPPLLQGKLRQDLIEKGLELSQPAHTIFSARKQGLTCTLYQSGKLVVQGKEAQEFIEFYLEPEILKTFGGTSSCASEPSPQDLTPHIGVDEAGKGDFFGPLCIASLYANQEEIPELVAMGVKDSKRLGDPQIRKLADKLKARFVHYVVKIGPKRYNEMYQKFKNLNRLLAWGHATCVVNLADKTGCGRVIVDKFADDWVVESALRKSPVKLEIIQRTKGEQDVVVAGASILARSAFLDGMDKLSAEAGFVLPKGASAQVVAAGKKLMTMKGPQALGLYGKTHFKTLDAILGQSPE